VFHEESQLRSMTLVTKSAIDAPCAVKEINGSRYAASL
jgi:hypothetical protein